MALSASLTRKERRADTFFPLFFYRKMQPIIINVSLQPVLHSPRQTSRRWPRTTSGCVGQYLLICWSIDLWLAFGEEVSVTYGGSGRKDKRYESRRIHRNTFSLLLRLWSRRREEKVKGGKTLFRQNLIYLTVSALLDKNVLNSSTSTLQLYCFSSWRMKTSLRSWRCRKKTVFCFVFF